jgi:hypothetical protein
MLWKGSIHQNQNASISIYCSLRPNNAIILRAQLLHMRGFCAMFASSDNGERKMKTLDQWFDLARASIRNVSDDNARRIAWLCFDAEQSGGKAATWHASSIIHGHKCNCVDCANVVGA